MAKWVFNCWSCKQETEMDDKVGRKDECPHCRSDMHACKNCQYFDVGSHNQCTETIAEYVPDKTRANFCGMYKAYDGERAPDEDIGAAKAKLEALFKKKK